MMDYYLLIVGLIFPMLGVCVQLGQGPHNEILEKRFFIPKNSKIRKIIPFREDCAHPFIYLKIIPFFVSIIISFAILILYAIKFFAPSIITPILIHPATIISSVLVGLLYMIYAGIMNAI
jgi:hypothetical protein